LNNNTAKLKYHIVEEATWSSSKTLKLVVFNDKSTVYTIDDSIQITHTFEQEKSEKEEYTYHTYKLKISSIDKNMNTVITFIKKAMEMYDEKQDYLIQKVKIYSLSEFHEDDDEPMYDEIEFNTTKNFNNMFFDEKQKLLHKIDDFERNYARYMRLGIPYTLGMLFHGEPGTGKTSAIKALANYTGRNIIVVPVKKVDTAEKLKKLFVHDRINDVKIPMRKRLYVFEEIDCSQWKSIVLDRKYIKDDETMSDGSGKAANDSVRDLAKTLKNAIVEECDEKASSKKKEGKLCLADILETLDGMVEIPGRLVVMTSNHPEMLDPALLRPGRIDMKIEFKKMTVSNVVDMYKLWFDEDIPQHVTEMMVDYTFSQAEIGNLFASNTKDEIFNALQSNSK
jgi:chaperone BCS1